MDNPVDKPVDKSRRATIGRYPMQSYALKDRRLERILGAFLSMFLFCDIRHILDKFSWQVIPFC